MDSNLTSSDSLALAAETSACPSTDTALESPQAPHKRDLIAGLEKGLMVIEAFDQERTRLTITQIAERTGLTRAAARRYLLTLSHLGYVTHDRKMFSLTPRVLRLGQSYMHSARLPRIVQSELPKLASPIRELAAAAVLDGNDVVCIASHNTVRAYPLHVHPGARFPAYCTSNGRVLAAALPDDELDAWLLRQDFKAHTGKTVTDRDLLRTEIERVREQGYSAVDQELEAGCKGLAIPLRNFRGHVVASLHVSACAPGVVMSEWVDECLPYMLQTQAELRSLL